jgi:hypothetical protein
MLIAHEGLPPRPFAPPPPLINDAPLPPEPDELLAGEEPLSPALVAIPIVVGRRAPEAAQLLRDAGFVPNVVSIAGTGDEAGTVIGQSPPGNTSAPPGTVIVLEVAV